MPLDVHIVPSLDDNYAYLVVERATQRAAVVDGADTGAVTAAVAAAGVTVVAVLSTHHHWDHAGGNGALLAAYPGVPVYGGGERVDELTHKVGQGDVIDLGGELVLGVRASPCHTTSHVLFTVDAVGSVVGGAAGEPVLYGEDGGVACPPGVFTGDTLLAVGGAGRFMEGTGAQMVAALLGDAALGSLDDATLVFSGHEYALGNLAFAVAFEPSNTQTADTLAWAQAQRASGLPTLPSTLGLERAINPFMRIDEPAIQAAAQDAGVDADDPAAVMTFVRQTKNAFRPS